jgi:hypothetical protein
MKRHVVVDTLGLLLKVVVHPADLHDRLGAKLVLGALGRPTCRASSTSGRIKALRALCVSGPASTAASS